MNQKRKKLRRKLLSFVLTLAMVVGLVPGMGLTAYAASTYSLVPARGQSGETYSITPSEDTLDAVKTALAAKMSLDTETKEIWLYRDEYGMMELDVPSNTMYYKVKSKPQEIVAGKTYVVGDSLYFHADKYYNNGFVQTGMDIFGSYTDYSKGQEVKRIESNNPWLASIGSQYLVLEEPSGHTYDSSVQPIGFKLADDSGDGSTAEKYIKFEAVYASSKTDQIVTAPVAVSNLTYTGSAQTLVSAATVTTGNTSGSITYSLDGTNYSADLPTGTNVGTYNVYYKVAGNDDYNEFVSASPVSVSIGKATPTVTAPTAKTLTENGATQALVNAGQTEDGTLHYALGKDVSVAPTDGWSNKIPTGKDAGTYYVWYMVKGDSNHNDSKPECVEVTINKKEETTETPSSYKNEWVKGQWYDANGKTGYKPQGQWKKNSTGWWYVDEAGWYPTNMWQKIDGKWYFFDDIGYMVTNAYAGKWSPYSEGYWWVGEDGAWDGSEPGVWRLSGTKWWFKDSTGWYAKGKSYNIGGNDYEFDADGWWIEK